MTPKAILFDLDGTLADSAPDLAAAANHLCTVLGRPLADYASLRLVASSGARGLIGAALGIAPGDPTYDALKDQFLDFYANNLAQHTRLFSGVERLLKTLDERRIPWGIVTNKASRFTDLLVPAIGLGHAACIVSGDTTPHSKPHPAPLFEAAQRLRVAPESCWYIGDDQRDIIAGKAAGMPTVAALWGYCDTSSAQQWGATHLCKNPMDVINLI